MEYMAMLAEPGLVSRLQELIDDKEPEVVKRTIRVFTNVYRHSLSLVASGELAPQKYEQSYAEISAVSNKLIGMLKTAENEGIIVHLVRYLEAALVSHILSDLSLFPHIAQMTAPVLKKGVDALIEFVRTPYVGGSAFCVAIRALISVACYQVNLRPCITELAEDLINTPPPNLFDHNIRSFHKTLQRNLFRLLKRAEADEDKKRLVNLMVRVGVPKRRLAEFVPRSKKRTSTTQEPCSSSRLSPPRSKRIKLTEEEVVKFRPSSSIELTPEEIRRFGPQSLPKSMRQSPALEKMLSDVPKEIPLEPKPKLPVSITSILDHILSDEKMPAASPESETTLMKAREKLSRHERTSNSPLSHRGNSLYEDKSQSREVSFESLSDQLHLDDSSPRSPSPPTMDLEIQSEFEKTILNLKLEKEDNLSDDCTTPFSVKCSLKEGMIYEKLDCRKVVDILLASPFELPKEMPASLQKTFIYDLKIMREKLAVALSAYLRDEDFSSPTSLMSDSSSKKIQLALNMLNSGNVPTKRRYSDDTDDKCPAKLEPASHSLNNSPVRGTSPVRDLLFSGQDVDLRQQLKNPGAYMMSCPSLKPAESQFGNVSSTLVTDSPASPESSEATFNNRDPRLASKSVGRQTNGDPRLEKINSRKSVSPPAVLAQDSSSRDPRLARKPANTSASADVGVVQTSMHEVSSSLPSAGVAYTGNAFRNSSSLPDVKMTAPTRDPRMDKYRNSREIPNTSSNIEHNFHEIRDVSSYTNSNFRDPRVNFSLAPGQMHSVAAQQHPKANSLEMSAGNSQLMPPVDCRQNVHPRLQTQNLDPRQNPNLDPRQNSNVALRQNISVDPREVSNVGPRQLSNADPRQVANADPRLISNVGPRQNNLGPPLLPNLDSRSMSNMDPRRTSNVAPRQNRQSLLGAPPRSLIFRGVSAPLLQTPPVPMMPPVAIYAAPTRVASTFGNSYAMSRYASAENRNRF